MYFLYFRDAPGKPPPPKSSSSSAVKKGQPVLPGRPGPGHPLYHHMMKASHGVALHDYQAQAHDELTFRVSPLF